MGALESLYNSHNCCGDHTRKYSNSELLNFQKGTQVENKILDGYEDDVYDELMTIFKNIEDAFWDKFDGKFAPAYIAEKSLENYISIYLRSDMLYEELQKSNGGIDNIIQTITSISGDVFLPGISTNLENAFELGGNSALGIMNVDIDFKIVNQRALDAIRKSQGDISKKVGKSINKKIKSELYAGVKAGESVQQIAKRIKEVWDKPIGIVVPALKDKDGNIIREAYTRYISADDWALTVARTEVNRAFIQGSLQAYRDSGVVTIVQLQTAPDERVCAICSAADMTEYDIKEAGNILPLHPNCRCAWVPIFDSKKYEGAVSKLTELYTG